jgi:hypothetical protein
MITYDTTIDADFPVYSRAHTAVVLPGVLSPLAWDLLGPALEEGVDGDRGVVLVVER